MTVIKSATFYGYTLEWLRIFHLPFNMPLTWDVELIKSEHHNNRKQILLTMANKIKEAGG